MLGMLTTGSQAYTLEQQEMCTGDAMRLCASDIPDVDRITACMIQRKSQLSPECRVFFKPDPAGKPRKSKKPTQPGAT